jgi:uncharacterized cupredoxin-like copper-binding protein
MVLSGALVIAATFGIVGRLPAAPAKRVIDVTMTSYKFEPNQIQITDGETVVIRLKNVDPSGRRHNFAATYLAGLPVTVRGDAVEGTSEGRRFVTVEPGKQAELEFVAKTRGSFAFLCSLFDHAEKGQTGTLNVRAPQ